MFPCEICVSSKNTFFTQHLWTTASEELAFFEMFILLIYPSIYCSFTICMQASMKLHHWITNYTKIDNETPPRPLFRPSRIVNVAEFSTPRFSWLLRHSLVIRHRRVKVILHKVYSEKLLESSLNKYHSGVILSKWIYSNHWKNTEKPFGIIKCLNLNSHFPFFLHVDIKFHSDNE